MMSGCSDINGLGGRKITLLDSGKVAISNPLRQSLYTLKDCGQDKATAAENSLKSIYPSVVDLFFSREPEEAKGPEEDEVAVVDLKIDSGLEAIMDKAVHLENVEKIKLLLKDLARYRTSLVLQLLSMLGCLPPQSSERKSKWVVIRRRLLQELNLAEAAVNILQTL